MPKYGNFENQPVSRNTLPVELKQAEFRPLGVERGYMCNVWHFVQLLSFMPKYGNFENRPISPKGLPVEKKISSILTPWKRSICGTVANGQVGSQAEHQGPWASCFLSIPPVTITKGSLRLPPRLLEVLNLSFFVTLEKA